MCYIVSIRQRQRIQGISENKGSMKIRKGKGKTGAHTEARNLFDSTASFESCCLFSELC